MMLQNKYVTREYHSLMGSSIYFKCTTNNIRRISWQYFEVKHRFAIDGILLVKGVEWFL